MPPTATDDPVAWCAKAAERIEVLFGVETLRDLRHTVLNGGSDLLMARVNSGGNFPIVEIGILLAFDVAFAKILWPLVLVWYISDNMFILE